MPSVSTPAHGRFKARIAPDGQSIDYELSYSDLAGTVQMSHIHFGQKSVNGSIVIWLCQTATTQAPPAVMGITPTCPQAGTVTGTITAANVIAASTASQLILQGELDEVIDAIKGGVAYVNVHSQPLNGGGEISRLRSSASTSRTARAEARAYVTRREAAAQAASRVGLPPSRLSPRAVMAGPSDPRRLVPR